MWLWRHVSHGVQLLLSRLPLGCYTRRPAAMQLRDPSRAVLRQHGSDSSRGMRIAGPAGAAAPSVG